MQKLPISGVVIAFNEADRIARCVASLAPLCDEVIVMDSGSTDDTARIATDNGARVVQQAWLGFSAQKNAVISAARNEWVLLLDSDEWLDDAAGGKIAQLLAGGEMESADVWTLLRRTHYLGTALNHGGWGKEKVERLFRRDLRYKQADVHEALDTRGKRVKALDARIEHDTARSDAEYAQKLDRYAELWAKQKHAAGRSANAMSGPLHAFAYWLKNFVLRGGFMDGGQAHRYHWLHTRYVYRKYALLARM